MSGRPPERGGGSTTLDYRSDYRVGFGTMMYAILQTVGTDDKGLDCGGDHTTLFTTQALALDKYVELCGRREKGNVRFHYGRYWYYKELPVGCGKKTRW